MYLILTRVNIKLNGVVVVVVVGVVVATTVSDDHYRACDLLI